VGLIPIPDYIVLPGATKRLAAILSMAALSAAGATLTGEWQVRVSQ
jgi:hypothetical protein